MIELERIVQFLATFFFSDFTHWLGLFLLALVAGRKIVINDR